MKKVFSNLKSALVMLTAIAGVAIFAQSCQYDDEWIHDEFGNIRQEIADLREQLENELNAIKDMVNGLVTITDVKQQQDGSKQIVLSDGTKINVYPKGDNVPVGLVTTTVVDGVLCWAQFDGLGNAQPIYVNGKVVPVADATPKTQVVDGVIEILSYEDLLSSGFISLVDSIISKYESLYPDVDGAVELDFDINSIDYKSRFNYSTESEADSDDYSSTVYTSDNGSIIMVKYQDAATGDFRIFIINYNNYDVTVNYMGNSYLVGKVGFVKI